MSAPEYLLAYITGATLAAVAALLWLRRRRRTVGSSRAIDIVTMVSSQFVHEVLSQMGATRYVADLLLRLIGLAIEWWLLA